MNAFSISILIVFLWVVIGIVVTILKDLFDFDLPGMLFDSDSPSKVFAKIDPDESLSAAFQEALCDPAAQVSADGNTIFLNGEKIQKIGYMSEKESRELNSGVPKEIGEAIKTALYAPLQSRVSCQFCGQPGEPMTVCTHCGGKVR